MVNEFIAEVNDFVAEVNGLTVVLNDLAAVMDALAVVQWSIEFETCFAIQTVNHQLVQRYLYDSNENMKWMYHS